MKLHSHTLERKFEFRITEEDSVVSFNEKQRRDQLRGDHAAFLRISYREMRFTFYFAQTMNVYANIGFLMIYHKSIMV